MKTLLALSFLIASNALAIDPNIEGQETLTITCLDPVTRTDGTVLQVGEIVNRKFHMGTNGAAYIDTNQDNLLECKQIFDLTTLSDGDYLFAVTAIDSDGRESDYSSTTVPVEIERLPNPNAPTSVTGVIS